MRHFCLFLFVLILAVLITCCSILKSSDSNDISFDGSSGQLDMLDYTSICGERIDIDCRACSDFCRNDVSSGCFQNRCSCGLGPECGSTSECRFDNCLETDPEGSNCEFDSECDPGFLCIRSRCSPAGCIPETCNGYDDDCDGRIDGTANGPLARWCDSDDRPSGPVSLRLPCRQGSQICVNGSWQPCQGGVFPYPEYGSLACDNIDNDCDGCVDGVMTEGICVQNENTKFDVVFAIDTSGSMEGVINAVRNSASMFASSISSLSNIKFGIVVFPHVADRDWGVLQTLVPFTYFNSTLSGLTLAPFGAEASLDVLFGLVNNSIAVGWSPDSTRVIIMFTDEAPQTYTTTPATEATICNASVRGEILAVVTRNVFFINYDRCALTFSLTEDAAVMAENLATIIQNPCN